MDKDLIVQGIEKDEKVLSLRSGIDALVKQAEAIEVKTDESRDQILMIDKKLKDTAKEIEEKKKENLKIPNLIVKSIKEIFDRYLEPIKKGREDIDKKTKDYFIACENIRLKIEAENKKKLAEIEAKKQKAIADGREKQAAKLEVKQMEVELSAPAPVERSIKVNGMSVNFRPVKKIKVVDPAKVPIEYMSPDEKKLQDAVDQGVESIPGCEIYEDLIKTTR